MITGLLVNVRGTASNALATLGSSFFKVIVSLNWKRMGEITDWLR
jgi:hypothetical protein